MKKQNNLQKILKRGFKGSSLIVTSVLVLNSFGVFSQEENAPKSDNTTTTWNSYWNNGYHVESSDKNFKMKFGGRIMADWAAALYQDDSLTTLHGKAINGTELRRVRFYNSGTIYKNVAYKIEFDFAGGTTAFKDIYIRIVDVPVLGNLQIGHFKEAFSLEEHTSSKNITFMERSLPTVFTPSRNSGFAAFNNAFEERLTWSIGVFRDADSFGNAKQSEIARHNVTGRITMLPLYNEETNQLLHLGVAYSMRNPDNNEYEIEEKPEAHMQHDYVATGLIDEVNKVGLLGVELAFVKGPFSLQGEFISSTVKRTTLDNTNDEIEVTNKFSGYYATASIFLTKDDHRAYEAEEGVFGRVKPTKNFGDGSLGAVEFAVRYSGLDLIDGAKADYNLISGGKLNDLTVGFNWYLNPATRVMLNYVMATVKGQDTAVESIIQDIGNAGFFQMRFQLDF